MHCIHQTHTHTHTHIRIKKKKKIASIDLCPHIKKFHPYALKATCELLYIFKIILMLILDLESLCQGGGLGTNGNELGQNQAQATGNVVRSPVLTGPHCPQTYSSGQKKDPVLD